MASSLSVLAAAYAQRHATLSQRSTALGDALRDVIARTLHEHGVVDATVHTRALQQRDGELTLDFHLVIPVASLSDAAVAAKTNTWDGSLSEPVAEVAPRADRETVNDASIVDPLQDDDLGLDMGARKPREKKSATNKKAKKGALTDTVEAETSTRAESRLPEVAPAAPAEPVEGVVLTMPTEAMSSDREALSALFPKATAPTLAKPIPAPPAPLPPAPLPAPAAVDPASTFVSRFPPPIPPVPAPTPTPTPAPLPPPPPAPVTMAVPYSRYTWSAACPTEPRQFGDVPLARTPEAPNPFKSGKANTAIPKPVIARVMAADFVHIHDKRLKDAATKSDREIRRLFEKDYQFTRQEFENRGASADDVVLFNTLLNQVAFDSRRIF